MTSSNMARLHEADSTRLYHECDKISSKLLKDLELTDYYCPDCKTKVNCKFAESRSSNSKMNSIENNQEHMIPGRVYAELERRVTFRKDMFMGAIFSGITKQMSPRGFGVQMFTAKHQAFQFILLKGFGVQMFIITGFEVLNDHVKDC
ncbi:hypothetical protein K1719_021702 [Acacia pycnantha]|nr:hypothetical protein K1719_021702 [Acacia pycnantha]